MSDFLLLLWGIAIIGIVWGIVWVSDQVKYWPDDED